ncbi:MAG: diacylglycerol/lipid kinase family protein [Paludibacteraceae bacterium]
MSEAIITSNHWLIITNPRAGKRQFMGQINYVKSELKKANIPYIFKITEYSGHAVEIAKQYTRRGCMNFLVLGGDGSISEVINGIFLAEPEDTTKIKIALMPRGTGNDWGRFWNLKKKDVRSMEIFLKGKSRLIDIGKLNYRTADNQESSHYFVNSVGFGLDAEVVDLTHKLKKMVGSYSFLYAVSLVLAVFRYKSVPAKLTINQEAVMPLKLFTMNIANGPFSGGGIKQNPTAVPYDGIFDMMVVEKPTIGDIFSILPLIFSDKLAAHRAIRSLTAKQIDVHIEQEMPVEADGILVPNAHNCKISILPDTLNMIIP